jgi:hypothetical protein
VKRLVALAVVGAVYWLYLAWRDSSRVWVRVLPDSEPTPFMEELRLKRT